MSYCFIRAVTKVQDRL